MPQQEKGISPSCALPYELYADGKLSADKSSFAIQFTAGNKIFGNKAAGAPFNVYAPGRYLHHSENGKPVFENVRTWAYGVTAGDKLTYNWPLNEFEDKHYHLRVYGPNGFFREFKGNGADPAIHIEFDYQRALTNSNKLTGNVELKITNTTGKPQVIEITDHSYKSNNYKKTIAPSAKSTIVLNLEKSHQWYDFGVKTAGYTAFEKRFSGRVETGKATFTDPYMGRVV